MLGKNHKQAHFCTVLTLVVSVSICAKLHAAPDRASVAKTYIPKFEKILTEHIAWFWYSKSLDRPNGGYRINFDSQGGLLKGEGTKMIVSQARAVWLFSRLLRAGYGGDEYTEAADLGYRFLKGKIWDSKMAASIGRSAPLATRS